VSYYLKPRDTLQWYGIDLDNTLAEPIWPEEGIGDPIWENVEKMKKVHAAGFKIMIHTSRYWGDYEMIKGWLTQWGLSKYVKEIQCGKPLYAKYVDDKAINADTESWL
jgi:hypothetical protein